MKRLCRRVLFKLQCFPIKRWESAKTVSEGVGGERGIAENKLNLYLIRKPTG